MNCTTTFHKKSTNTSFGICRDSVNWTAARSGIGLTRSPLNSGPEAMPAVARICRYEPHALRLVRLPATFQRQMMPVTILSSASRAERLSAGCRYRRSGRAWWPTDKALRMPRARPAPSPACGRGVGRGQACSGRARVPSPCPSPASGGGNAAAMHEPNIPVLI